MTLPPWHEEPIAKKHNREVFDCGDAALNDFLRRHARQTHEQGGAKTFLAVRDDDAAAVLGFYSLSPASVEFSRAPDVVKRGLARHDVPVFRLGRLAVDQSLQGNGLGGQLLLSAGRRCLRASQEVGGVVESLAFKICAHAKELNDIRLNVKDLRGNGLEQCYAYLTKVVGLKQLQDNPHYAQLAFLTHIRNALVHNQGTLREADKLESQLKQWDSVSLNQFGGVRLSKNFNEKMLSHVRDLGLDIFAALRESFGR